ncbi:MAG: ribosome small subunit-dependent GTPase A [Paludibacter sp.]
MNQLGWRPFFAHQLASDESEAVTPARVTAVHRTLLEVLTSAGELQVTLPGLIAQQGLAETVAVGDWLLVDARNGRVIRVLERQSTLARLAAGERQQRQLIAANVDTLFIVTSCNDDFNLSRLERYFALANAAGVEPVVVLTKADLSADVNRYLDELRDTAPNVIALAVNATAPAGVHVLAPWLAAGQTVAFAGSSGVGKSTLVNTLSMSNVQGTAGIREDDSKGRHTTTSRQMLQLQGGAWVIDTPGMRELKLHVGEQALNAVFDDIEVLSAQCKFRDCAHQDDEGCAIWAAINRGELDERRLMSYQKLLREAANASRTVRERRERERQFGKLVKSVMKQKRVDRGQE